MVKQEKENKKKEKGNKISSKKIHKQSKGA